MAECILLLIVFGFLSGCSSVKQLAIQKDVNQLINKSEVFSNQFTGFSIYDIEAERYIAQHNAQLKFTPASNTKLLTMYAVLKTFPEAIPSLIYEKDSVGIIVQPIGDPTFLYEPFTTQKTYDFLKSQEHLKINWPEESIEPFGSGWAWDDYSYDFQPQRSWWPIYGNTLSITKANDSLIVSPAFFMDYVDVKEPIASEEKVERNPKFNVFSAYLANDTSQFVREIPFEYSKDLFVKLLSDTLKTKVSLLNKKLISPDTLYSFSTDLVLAFMMKPSDNFLAEQLLILAAQENGFSKVSHFIGKVKSTWLSDLSDIVWVDGSGLSRYNLISPEDHIKLLKKCYDEFGWARITSILPSGGEGTLKEYYKVEEDESSFIFAKTGTLSNNHNLSGYLVTRSGKRMIFSFMNNHYTRPTKEIKEAMEQFLIEIKNAY